MGEIPAPAKKAKEPQEPRKVCHSFKDYGPTKPAICKFAHVSPKGKILVPEKSKAEEKGLDKEEKKCQ